MQSSFFLRRLFVVALLVCLASQTNDMSFIKQVNAGNIRSSYLLPSCSQGDTISAYVIQNGGQNAFSVQLWAPAITYPSGSPEQTASLSGSVNYNSSPVRKSGQYTLQILPSNPGAPGFAYNIRIEINNYTVGTYTDVARYDRIFAYYHQTMGNYQAIVTTPPGMASSYSLSVYGPFQTLQISGGTQVPTTVNQGAVTYKSVGGEFFYLVVHFNDNYIGSNENVNIKYQTDLYACPYNQGYTDRNLVYQGCSNTMPTNGYPCSNFDPNVQKCLACHPPWIANSAGVCMQNTNCQSNQYYSYGQCYNVISNCANFQYFGGLCYNCTAGYNLVNQTNGTQSCVQAEQVCTSTQYLMGTTCYNLVPNCNNFQSTTATCFSCQAGFLLQNNSCAQQVSDPLNCPLGQTNSNGICTAIDQYCIFYNPDNTCMLCAKGYQIVYGRCNKIECGSRQFSGSGSCVDVSPFCVTFDQIYGNCLTCIPLYYMQADGSCIQGLPTMSSFSQGSDRSNQATPCPDNYYSRSGTCVQISPSCGNFDSNTGFCTTCASNSYYLNQTNGACVLISTLCGYRTYFSNGNCLPVSDLCDQFDSSTGYCLSCRDGSVLTSTSCIFEISCGDRQYHAADGSCVDVSDKCGDYDASTGACLSCVKDYELNDGGVCCYAYNYMNSPQCVKFFAKNCVSQRPQFFNCLKCQTGYSLVNGVFGRCNPPPN